MEKHLCLLYRNEISPQQQQQQRKLFSFKKIFPWALTSCPFSSSEYQKLLYIHRYPFLYFFFFHFLGSPRASPHIYNIKYTILRWIFCAAAGLKNVHEFQMKRYQFGCFCCYCLRDKNIKGRRRGCILRTYIKYPI